MLFTFEITNQLDSAFTGADIDPTTFSNQHCGMTDGKWWAAMVTFERRSDEQDILPEWAHGACGWMVAWAPDEKSARSLLVRDVEHHGLRVVEIEDEHEVFTDNEIGELDDHLELNFRKIESGKQTVWGTIHCFKGEGEA